MIIKCDNRLIRLNIQSLKNSFKSVSLLLLFFASSVTPSYGWSLFVGEYTNNQGRDTWGGVKDFSKNYSPANMLNPIAIHNGSGLREISVSNNATELDPGTGLSCNRDGDNHVLVLYHGYTDSGKTYNNNKLWETNTTGMYIGLEVTAINFGGQYWDKTPFWINWNSGNTPNAQKFDLTNITSRDDRFGNCSRVTNYTYYGLGGIVLWVKYHLFIDDSFDPAGATSLSVSLKKQQSYDFQFASSPAFTGSYSVNYTISPNDLRINYPTCQANAVTGDGVTNSTVPFGEYSAKDIPANNITRKFSIKLSNCAYVKELNVTLSSTAVGEQDKTLLGNTLTSSAANGIGVMIEGEENPNSPADWTLLNPNISSSIYSFTNSPDYKNSERGNAEQVMNFQATLKQDGSKTITPGQFKATGKFTITYP